MDIRHFPRRGALLTSLISLLTQIAMGAPSSVTSCTECHGDHGVSANEDIPSIAGMSDYYLEGQMRAYQKAQRPCPKSTVSKIPTDMCELAKTLTPAQIKEIGSYYAAQTWVAAPQPAVDAAKAARGKSIHANDCELCHTKGGSVADDDAGILAGQWLSYLQLTLNDYKSGKRTMPDKMKPKLEKLSGDDLDALSQFYAAEGSASK